VKDLIGLLTCRGEFFHVQGCPAFLMLPATTDSDRKGPWVWYAPAFSGLLPDASHAWMFSRFLDKGIAIAGVDVGESCGAPSGRAIYTVLYERLCAEYALAESPCLLVQSRGALMLYNWAIENPHRVGCIAGIFPLCTMRWFYDYRMVCAAYGLSRMKLMECIDELGPLGRLGPLAGARVPIIHIQGDRDIAVPLEDNSGTFEKEYLGLGGNMELIVVPGKGHEVVPELFQCQALVDFAIRNLKLEI